MPLLALTIFLSATLLFLVQPIMAKQILPWFGGSAAVWTTCMVFFQCTLLGGYAYADWLARRPMRLQAQLHAALAAASLAALPIVPAAAWRPAEAAEPIGRILLLLAATIGLPYFMLSTTGPLVQSWVARAFPQRRVYRLYALSNVGSLAALVAYPVLIEPAASVRAQSIGWSAGYAAFVLMVVAGGWLTWRCTQPGAAPAAQQVSAACAPPSGAPGMSPAPPESVPAPSLAEQARWLLLAALGSTLLLAVTTHITQNIASVPFLWILPLSLYLLTFVLCFEGRSWWRPGAGCAAAIVLGTLMMGALVGRLDGWWPEAGLMPVRQAVPLYCAGLFAGCMFCHGELAARRPAPRHLTRFYLMLSAGGAAGGILVGIVAPLALPTYHELPASIVLLVVLATLRAPRIGLRVLGVASLLACGAALWLHLIVLTGDTVLMHRNFYGTMRVRATGTEAQGDRARRLMHGGIVHGEQFLAPSRRGLPTTYYGERSGVGHAVAALRAARPGPQRLGLIGMGVGTLAAYGRAGDQYRFYELDPDVPRLARRQFTYLSDSAAHIETVLGDARLTLEREPPQRFDLLAIDAFSGDSIPTHLLTRQAMQAYRRHLAEGGVIAFHVSNRYLDLAPVVRRLADEAGLQAVRLVHVPPESDYLYRSDWVLVTADAALAAALRAAGGTDAPQRADLRTWTDDFNNLLQVLK